MPKAAPTTPRRQRLKIAVSGYTGTGKSTLCRELARRLNLQLVEEDTGRIVQVDNAGNEAIRANRGDRKVFVQAKSELAQAYRQWSSERTQALNGQADVIADGWHADLLIWWMLAFMEFRGEAEKLTGLLSQEMSRVAQGLDYIVITPFERPFTRTDDDAGESSFGKANGTAHLLYQTLLRGLLLGSDNAKIIQLPPALTTVEARADYIEQVIGTTSTGATLN